MEKEIDEVKEFTLDERLFEALLEDSLDTIKVKGVIKELKRAGISIKRLAITITDWEEHVGQATVIKKNLPRLKEILKEEMV